MNRTPKALLYQIIIAISVLFIAVCFIFSIVTIESLTKADCFETIEETTLQSADMFNRSIQQSREHLMLFANILTTNTPVTDELLQSYMKYFCETQSFSAICIHWRDGREAAYGDYLHRSRSIDSFDAEVARMPYISDVHSVGNTRKESYIYQAVPIMRDGQTIAAIYGYMSLDTFPDFVSSTYYDGRCQFYIVDGNLGNFLMDEYHRYDKNGDEIPLSNVFDGSMTARESKPGYLAEDMMHGIAAGKSGYHIFKSQRTGQWYYTYYMPLGINNWSMQLTIDEPTAFATYFNVRSTILLLMVCVVVLSVIILLALYCISRKRQKQDAADLHKADYLNAVQSALITAHNNPDFVSLALKLVAKEIRAETALLLTFTDHVITHVYYWPSLDMNRASAIIGVNIRETFPVMFDTLTANESFFCDEETIASRFVPQAKALFEALSISTILLVPITDNAGALRGAIATINMNGEVRSPEMLELVTRDFFMAISNLENHNIIRKMGTTDYLTGIKNRNSFEAESPGLETLEANSLWCVYIDVNGLHELNNTIGHTAGDVMLCAVAASIRKIYGIEQTYRLGGDEFVAFRTDSTHDELLACKHRLLNELAQKGYSVSVGFEGCVKNENRIFDVAKVMADAETIMYAEKQKYYRENGISPKRSYTLPELNQP